MSEFITPLFEFYYNKSLKEFHSLSLTTQLMFLDGHRVVVIDYYGISPYIINKFPRSFKFLYFDHRKDKYSDVQAIAASYDVVYAITHKQQYIKFNYTCINLIYNKKSLVESTLNII